MEVEFIPTGPLGVNTSIIINRSLGEAALIDPGGDVDLLIDKIESQEVKLTAILHTHAHFDHIWGTVMLAQRMGPQFEECLVGLSQEDRFLYENVSMQADNFGFDLEVELPQINTWFDGMTAIKAAGIEFQLLHTPGHSPGSYSLYWENREAASGEGGGIVFTGDALFQGSIGRTDLWKGDLETLLRSIHTKLLTLPPNTRVIPGHGPETTIAREAAQNPFLSTEKM